MKTPKVAQKVPTCEKNAFYSIGQTMEEDWMKTRSMLSLLPVPLKGFSSSLDLNA